ncbi:MAG TPA: hypothetical protein VMW27_09370 [Thermoanaerobaculia bacterium]|nr:hypothetical protein [Thermoanaerobaculia bacterium]
MPFPSSSPPSAVRETRGHDRLMAPPRSAVPIPGQGSAFGPGFFQRLRSSGGGCFLIFFMMIGLSLGLFGVAGTFGPYRDTLRESGDPRFFLAAMGFGLVFFLMPLRMLQIELTGGDHVARRRRANSKGSAPWKVDYPWRPEGMDPDYLNPGGSALGVVAFLCFVGLFNIAWASDSLLFRVVIVFLDLLGLLILVDALLKLWQAVRHRRPRVRWTTFPAFLGGRLEGVVEFARPLAATGPVQVALRCVQDEEVVREDPEDGHSSTTEEAFIVYTQTREVLAGEGRLRTLPLAFDVPSDVPGTDLGRKLPTYWQVTVQVPLTGPDFDAVFLAPVYKPR